MTRAHRLLTGLVLLLLGANQACAQTSTDREMGDAVAHAYSLGTPGPAAIPLRDLANLQLPKDLTFVPNNSGRRLMHGMGNTSGDQLLGLILPSGAYGNWFIALSVIESGNVSPDAITKLDLADVHATVRSAARRGNAARMQLGSSPIEAGAWVEPPKYDAARHRFTTAIRIYESGPSTNDEDSINIDTYVFGRMRTIEVSLVAGHSDYARRRAAFDKVVEGLSFLNGQGYQDFVAGKDLVATHVMDVVFGGRTMAEIDAEAAEEAAAAKYRASIPRGMDKATQIKLLFFGLLGVVALILLIFALRSGRSSPVSRDIGVGRAIRSAPRS
jgi:uncharacterized membrane-anchored protein